MIQKLDLGIQSESEITNYRSVTLAGPYTEIEEVRLRQHT